MREKTKNKRRILRHAKLIAGFILVILLLSLSSHIVQLPIFRPSYHGTVTISPVQEEFFLNMDFYPSEEDALAKTNSFRGYEWRIDPSDEEQQLGFTVSIPIYEGYVWLKIYFNEISETPSNFHCLRVGQIIQSFLLDVELSIYIEPN